MGKKVCASAALGAALGASLAACQTFLEVHQIPFRPPEFSWKSGEPVQSLSVLADPRCPLLTSQSYQDRVWWQLSGVLKPPIHYGIVPKGAVQQASPRPLDASCGPWTVTVTDATLRAESSTFSLRQVTPLPMSGP